MERLLTIILPALILVMTLIVPCQAADRCYELGYRFGRCVTMAYYGMDCNPEDDSAMAVECRKDLETKRGLAQGMRDTDQAIRKLRGN